jgi:U4/U6 small nuclear ribonucleoprotein PRP4
MSWILWDCTRLQQIYSQKGHQKEIHCSTLHSDGSLYFTGDLGGWGKIWDLRTGKGIYELK